MEFVAELLHKILLRNFFCYFEFVAIFCSSEEEEFVAEFFCCFEFVAAIFFFAGCRIFVLFWSVKLQQSLLHFQEKRLCCRILCCFEVCCCREIICSSVEVNFFVVFGACCSNHFAFQEKRNLFQIFVVVVWERVAAIFGGSREEIELKGGDGGIFAANMTGTESQEAAVVTEVIIVLDKPLLEEETIKR